MPDEPALPQEWQPFQLPQEQVVSDAMIPQELQPQRSHWLQPQEKSPATRPQGAQGLQAGVPSLATRPQLLQLQVLQPQPVEVARTLPQPQWLCQPQFLPQEMPAFTWPQERELQLQLLISCASVTWSVGLIPLPSYAGRMRRCRHKKRPGTGPDQFEA